MSALFMATQRFGISDAARKALPEQPRSIRYALGARERRRTALGLRIPPGNLPKATPDEPGREASISEEPSLLLPGFGIGWGTAKALLLEGREANLEGDGIFGAFWRRQT